MCTIAHIILFTYNNDSDNNDFRLNSGDDGQEIYGLSKMIYTQLQFNLLLLMSICS